MFGATRDAEPVSSRARVGTTSAVDGLGERGASFGTEVADTGVMHTPRLACLSFAFVTLGTLVMACGGSDSSSGSSSSPSSGGNSPTEGTCSCSVSVNGASTTIACGGTGCVGGTEYACGDDAAIVKGGSCTASTSSSGGTPDAGSTSSSGGTATTVPCNQFSGPKECDAKTQYCIRAKFQSGGSGGEVCVSLPAGCIACPCVEDTAEAAWKKAQNGTNNCTGAVITCASSNGAITVTCTKP
jgi:hypothetical protein